MGDWGLSFLKKKKFIDHQSFHRPNAEMAICGIFGGIFGTVVKR